MEARLNEYPQFTTIIDGQNFLHIRSPGPDALPEVPDLLVGDMRDFFRKVR